jgi:hypothetical protein
MLSAQTEKISDTILFVGILWLWRDLGGEIEIKLFARDPSILVWGIRWEDEKFGSGRDLGGSSLAHVSESHFNHLRPGEWWPSHFLPGAQWAMGLGQQEWRQ